ncbi:MAG TPA: carboxymuconolactone decarboxylase family protein [Actinomycetota bacterium]|nr:carboxymuconolactone decarboxylase family protein [Actinomycetota bacterium]
MTARIAAKPAGLSPFRRVSYVFAKWLTRRLTRHDLADAPEPLRVLGHRPLLMSAYGAMEIAMMWSRALDPRLKELVRARVGTIHGCPW